MASRFEQAWTWPDVTLLVVDTLAAALVDVEHVGARIPDPMPASLVRVQRVGGARDQVLDRARLLVESWAVDAEAAWAVCDAARDALRRLPYLAGVVASDELSAPALLTDAATSRPYYLLTVEVTVKPSPAPVP